MANNADQKTEKPTQRRRRRAREEGEVAISGEVNNAFALLAGVGALVLFGGYTLQCMLATLTDRLGHMHTFDVSFEGAVTLLLETTATVIKAAMPLFVLALCVGLLCSLAQTGALWVPKRLALNFAHINPARGLKNLFSLNGLVGLVTAVIKIAVIGAIFYLVVRARLPWLAAASGADAWGILNMGCRLSVSLLVRVCLAMLGVAVLDYGYQRWRYERRLMMSVAELKEERKRDEGDPMVRGRQAQIRRNIVRQRMIQAVPSATVVVSNPTHFAVALKWDQKTMSAPTVVAKGRDALAERIKQIARRHGVPVLERKELAQSLYKMVEVGMQIPPKLYYAVAEVLAFLLRKRKRR